VPAILTSKPTIAFVDPGTGLKAGSHATSITSTGEFLSKRVFLEFENKSFGNVTLIPGIEKCERASSPDMLATATLDVETEKASEVRMRGRSTLNADWAKPLKADSTLSADNAEISSKMALVHCR
jgi:hypothetical protein